MQQTLQQSSTPGSSSICDMAVQGKKAKSSTPDPSSTPDNISQHCMKHSKELIKLYCHYHKAPICNVCLRSEHTNTSCKFNNISDISDQVIDSKEFQDILKAMDSITDKCRKSEEDMKEMTAESDSSLADVIKDVKNFRQELNQRLEKLERQLEDTAKVIKQKNNKNLNTVAAICGEVNKSLKTSSDTLKHLNASKQADRLFMEVNFAEQMIKNFENKIQQLKEYDVKVYIFKPNEEISEFLNAENLLGTLRHKTLRHFTPPQTYELKSRKASYQGEISVKTSKDKLRCGITGMCLLAPDRLIITDFDNKAIKMIGICSHSVIDHLQLFTNPHDITSVTSSILAATLPNKNTIQFISASSNKLTMKHSLKVDRHCFGISCCHEKLVVSYFSPGKLQILDINGTILTTVREEYVFGSLQYVAASQTGIFVCDNIMKRVASLNWQGDVTGVYQSEGKPQGIALSDDGTVYVCDKEQGVIEEISSDCCVGKAVLNALKNPRAVCWCSEQSLLYFSCSSEKKKYDNYLQIYKLS
ncbi:uncharacterized protein LOC128557006 [Mercenaria mercenaria]|uniref:uncharacterized protein LOC128557006 n=1 Tax=Mercenaria mercenaria TaxID=6596 RepID=UPI00234F27CC|nr:uncharacterized protein LOC128557006 [Mercenaria mercenaria]